MLEDSTRLPVGHATTVFRPEVESDLTKDMESTTSPAKSPSTELPHVSGYEISGILGR